ncbi:hypothetical protein BH11MYX4_BH11MYX4_17450 [soil metagenome]
MSRSRVARAKTLLSETETPVTRIALEIGCASVSSFSVLFRKWEGTTPSEYGRRGAGTAETPPARDQRPSPRRRLARGAGWIRSAETEPGQDRDDDDDRADEPDDLVHDVYLRWMGKGRDQESARSTAPFDDVTRNLCATRAKGAFRASDRFDHASAVSGAYRDVPEATSHGWHPASPGAHQTRLRQNVSPRRRNAWEAIGRHSIGLLPSTGVIAPFSGGGRRAGAGGGPRARKRRAPRAGRTAAFGGRRSRRCAIEGCAGAAAHQVARSALTRAGAAAPRRARGEARAHGGA